MNNTRFRIKFVRYTILPFPLDGAEDTTVFQRAEYRQESSSFMGFSDDLIGRPYNFRQISCLSLLSRRIGKR